METKLIEYIGKQINRVDDVLHTARRWPKPGAVLEIPVIEALRYLDYPTEWREVTKSELTLRADAEKHAQATLTKLVDISSSLPASALREAAQTLNRLAVEREQQEAADRAKKSREIADAAALLKRSGAVKATEGTGGSEYSEKRLNDIRKAMDDVDLNDREKMSAHGVPLPAAFEELLNFVPTEGEIEAALKPAEAPKKKAKAAA